MSEIEKHVFEAIADLLELGDDAALKAELLDMHPADVAEIVSWLDHDKRLKILLHLDPEKLAEVLIELDGTIREPILDEMNEATLVAAIGTLESDDATDLIGELDEEKARRVLAAMPWKEFREVETLLRHDEDTAGGIMAVELMAVKEGLTAQQALDALRRKSDEVDDVYNIYVVDNQGVLKGVITLKEMVLASPESPIASIMNREPITVHEDEDQEEVANLFSKYDLISAPVVNVKGQLVGRITVDDVLDVVEEEASEDIARMAGISYDHIQERSIFKLSSVRLPWLLVAFVGELLSAKVLQHFMPQHGREIVATFFVPLIMAMGGNMGIQSSTVVIRGLALGDIQLRDTKERLLRELSVGLFNGVIIAILAFSAITLLFHQIQFGLILSMALLSVLLLATTVGTLMPLLLKRIGIDPAVATGPFITTSNDVLGLVVYFTIIRLVAGAF